MNREIEFRAKTKCGIWFYWKINDPIDMATLGIDWETLGQFTGLFDKNGKKIYEGDIVEVANEDFDYLYPIEKKRRQYPNPLLKGVIEWNSYMANYEINGESINEDLDCWVTLVTDTTCESDIGSNEIKIIGNIYENQEFIKENI